MTRLYIAGIAMTVFGRHLERSLHDLAGEAFLQRDPRVFAGRQRNRIRPLRRRAMELA